MICLIQRVKKASVAVENKESSSIEEGLVVFVGFERADEENNIRKFAEKLINLKIFEKDNKLSLSVRDISGEILVIPNFTLCGLIKKGRGIDFSQAKSFNEARELFYFFVKILKEIYNENLIKSGIFGEHMRIDLELDGPVCLIWKS